MLALLTLLLAAQSMVHAQTPSSPANTPVSIPAGAADALPAQPPATKPAKVVVSAKQAREADDAYLAGAKEIQRKNVVAAEKDFARAVQLNPYDRDYALALIVTRESHLNELVQQAAKARLLGDPAKADALLEEARAIDPTNPVVMQHFAPGALAAKTPETPPIGASLAPPIQLAPKPGKHDFHLSGDAQTVIRNVYSAYGIKVSFDASYSATTLLPFEIKGVTFDDATRVLAMMGHFFAVPVQTDTALIAKDTQDNRDALMPLVEETIYMPGLGQDQMTELANLARNVFDVKQVTASATGGYMLLRGDENVLQQVNATYADMLDGGSEVLFDIDLYEIDTTKTRNIGATLPTSIGAFDLLSSAQKLIAANQAILAQAYDANLLTLTGTTGQQTLEELVFLIAAGVTGSSQFSNLLAYAGTDGGLPLAGLSVASGSTFALALNSTDARMLDAVTIRSGNHQAVNFRAGTRYPVVTAIYSTPSLSGLASAAAAAGISAATIAQYGGSAASASVPQFQFEDLGITVKMTPQILHNSEVSLSVDMKIEALAGGTINSIPILNNRTLTSTVTVPAGHTALLATLLNTNETKSLDGLPGLSELPGFQGTDQDREKDSTELLITITPHIVRTGSLHVTSKRLAAVRTGNSGGFAP